MDKPEALIKDLLDDWRAEADEMHAREMRCGGPGPLSQVSKRIHARIDEIEAALNLKARRS